METLKIEEQIKKILNKIRPYLNSEGGDLEYLGFKDGIVYIRMLGACIDCGALDSTLKDGIEALLVENIPEVIEVKNLALGDEVDGLSS
ncbi:MAG: NifU family protein, partial [Anaeroplasmataceae bacterium]|nr:NifU family protein [Anaeroplasmataceae bacterium]